MINLKYRRNLMASAVVAMLGVMPVNAVQRLLRFGIPFRDGF